MSTTSSRVLAFDWLLVIVVIVNIASAKTNLESSKKYTYGDTFIVDEPEIEIRCQMGNTCETFCYQQNKTSPGDGNILNDTRCATTGYHIVFVFTKVTTLRAGWFVNTAFITKVTIRDDGSITTIEPGAFDDYTFRHVWSLELRGTAIASLQRGALAGLNNLKSLSLYANSKMKEIEENALLGLYQLEEFTMEEQKNLTNLKNITENIEWKFLQSLNLSNNSFASTIVAPTFKGCAKVKRLILSNSEIEAFGANSFQPMEDTIEILDVSKNLLKQLPSGLLENLIRRNVQLYLSRNLWDCSCASGAQELQRYEISNPQLIIDSPLICETPLTEKGNCMINVSIECFTTPYPYQPTTSESPDKNLEQLRCFDQTHPSQPGIAVETELQFFKIMQDSEDKITVTMNYPDSDLALVYLNDHDYQARCQYNLKRKMEFSSLNSKAGYLFCLIRKSSHGTSPRNCLPFHFQTDFIWDRDRILVTLVCSFVLAIVLGIVIGCLLICRYRRASRVATRQGSRDSKTRMSIDDFNALSPYHHRHFFMHPNETGTNLRRSASENTLDSQKTYMTPSPVFDVMQRISRKSELQDSDYYSMKDYIDKRPYDIAPPPLPPLNSARKENFYARVPPPLPPLNSARKEGIYARIGDPPFNDEYVSYIYLKRKKY